MTLYQPFEGGIMHISLKNVLVILFSLIVLAAIIGSEVHVPEPAILLLFGTGLAGIAAAVRKKRKNA